MATFGIDVSKWNGNINWDTVKPQIDFAIIRCGYGKNIESQDDPYWHTNAQACAARGIPFGSYLYAHAKTVEAAISEAEHAIRLLNGYKLDYPVFYDMEDEDQVTLDATLLGDIMVAWAERIRAAGYYPAVYANKNWMTNYLTDPRFNNYDRWVAQYNDKLTWSGPYTMWQYTSDGVINGSSPRTDLNYCYVDYPSIINPKTPEPEQPTDPEPEIPEDNNDKPIVKPEEPTPTPDGDGTGDGTGDIIEEEGDTKLDGGIIEGGEVVKPGGINPHVPFYQNNTIREESIPFKEPTLLSGKCFPHNSDNITMGMISTGTGATRFGMIQTEMESFKTNLTKTI